MEISGAVPPTATAAAVAVDPLQRHEADCSRIPRRGKARRQAGRSER